MDQKPVRGHLLLQVSSDVVCSGPPAPRFQRECSHAMLFRRKAANIFCIGHENIIDYRHIFLTYTSNVPQNDMLQLHRPLQYTKPVSLLTSELSACKLVFWLVLLRLHGLCGNILNH